MAPEQFEEKMRTLAHKYFYEEDKELHEPVEVPRAVLEAIDLMIITLAENGFDKGIFQYKNFIE